MLPLPMARPSAISWAIVSAAGTVNISQHLVLLNLRMFSILDIIYQNIRQEMNPVITTHWKFPEDGIALPKEVNAQ